MLTQVRVTERLAPTATTKTYIIFCARHSGPRSTRVRAQGVDYTFRNNGRRSRVCTAVLLHQTQRDANLVRLCGPKIAASLAIASTSTTIRSSVPTRGQWSRATAGRLPAGRIRLLSLLDRNTIVHTANNGSIPQPESKGQP